MFFFNFIFIFLVDYKQCQACPKLNIYLYIFNKKITLFVCVCVFVTLMHSVPYASEFQRKS